MPKAAATGADAVCVDLEDAVALTDKPGARAAVWDQLAVLRSLGMPSILRINAITRPEGLRDMVALIDSSIAPDALFIPKCDSAEEVRWIDSLLDDRHRDMEMLPIIETTIGLNNVAAIAGASPRVSAMGFGSADFSAEIGSDMGWVRWFMHVDASLRRPVRTALPRLTAYGSITAMMKVCAARLNGSPQWVTPAKLPYIRNRWRS